MTTSEDDSRIYTLGEENPYKAVVTLVRQLFLYVPLLLLLDHLFGFGGMLWAQPVTEVIMMTVSVLLLLWCINQESIAV